MTKRIAVFVVVAGLVGCAVFAQTQTTTASANRVAEKPRAYVGGALLASIEAAGTYPGGQHWLSSPLSGTTVGASVFIDGPVNRFFCLEAEVSVDRSISGQQSKSDFPTTASFTRMQRELIFSGLARFNPDPIVHKLGIQPLVGISLARDTTEDTDVVFTTALPPGTPPMPGGSRNSANVSGGLVFGFDLALPISARVSIAPTARLYWLFLGRNDQPSLGLGPIIYRLGISARLGL